MWWNCHQGVSTDSISSSIYGIDNPADEKSDNVSIAGLILGGGAYAGLQAGAIEAAKEGAKETVKALFGWVPGVGSALNAAIAGGTTEAVGFALIAYCENHSWTLKCEDNYALYK